MSVPQPNFKTLTNPGFPRHTRVMIDGQEGTILDHTHSRWERLIMMRGSLQPELTSVKKISRAWTPGGQEYATIWDDHKSLVPWVPLLTREQQAD